MGAEVRCTVSAGGRRSEGKACLETDYVQFRGEFRLHIPLKEITSARAAAGSLHLTYPQGEAEFEIGPAAERWAARILNPPSLLDKLGVKPGHRVSILDVEDDGFTRSLQERVEDVHAGSAAAGSDVILLGVDDATALGRIGELLPALKPDGALWIVAPKGVQRVREADVFRAGKLAGLVDTKVARFSETHTAHKFVVPVHRRAALAGR